MNELRERARHHWQGILSSLGISGSLKNKHQPCPVCGGKDRFRFDDKDGYGTFICNQCGAGDGFKLIMNLLHCDFKHAASIVESYLGTGWVNAIAPTPVKTQEKPEKPQDKQAKLLSIFEQAKPLTPDSPAVQYLHQRGITLRARAYCSFNNRLGFPLGVITLRARAYCSAAVGLQLGCQPSPYARARIAPILFNQVFNKLLSPYARARIAPPRDTPRHPASTITLRARAYCSRNSPNAALPPRLALLDAAR